MENPNFYAIIPANVRYDNELTANAKLLYGEITALCNSKGFCWATNEYFANLYGVSRTSISNWINALIKKGYITRELIYKEGSKEVLNRYLRIFEGVPKEIGIPPQENFNTPPQENFKDNNTLFNNTINNTNNNICSPSGECGIATQQVEEIWLLYPNKKGKATAIKKIPKLIKEHGYEKIKKCVERYALECKGKDKQYIKHGSTFFNGGYMDYLDENIAEANENEYVVGEMRML